MVDPSDFPVLPWIGLFVLSLIAGLSLFYTGRTLRRVAAAAHQAAQTAGAFLRETEHARREACAPRLVVYFDNTSPLIAQLVIENGGSTTATDLTLRFEPALRTSNDDPAWPQFLKVPITVPPNSRVVHAFDTWNDYFTADCPRRYAVTLCYRRLDNRERCEQVCALDAGLFEHRHVWRAKGMEDLVEVLERFAKRTEHALRDMETDRRTERLNHGLEVAERGFSTALAAVLGILDLLAAAESSGELALSPQQVLPALRRATITALAAAAQEAAGERYRKPLLALLCASHHRGWNFIDGREADAAFAAASEALRKVCVATEAANATHARSAGY